MAWYRASGVDASGVTAQAGDVRANKKYINADGELVNGSMPDGTATVLSTVTQSNPSISVNGSGLVTANVGAKSASVTPTVSAGYIASGTAGTVNLSAASGTLQLSTQAAKTVTPGVSQQTAVTAGKYVTGNVVVAGDADLVAANIRKGVSIFGVTGSCAKHGYYTGTHRGTQSHRFYVSSGQHGPGWVALPNSIVVPLPFLPTQFVAYLSDNAFRVTYSMSSTSCMVIAANGTNDIITDGLIEQSGSTYNLWIPTPWPDHGAGYDFNVIASGEYQ